MNLKNCITAFVTAIAIAFSVGTAEGGELTLKTIKENAFDLSARDGQTARKDKVGNPCALLRIELPIEKVSFEGNVLGDVPYKGNEHWVYVAGGTKTIKIRANGFDTMTVDLTSASGPTGVKGSMVYNINIGGYESSSSRSASTPMRTDNYLYLTVSPKNAVVDIDNLLVSVVDGTVSKRLPYGTHTYSVRSPGFDTKTGSFEITSKEKTTLDVTLESIIASLTVVSQTPGATISIEGQTAKTGQWSGQLEPGVYAIEVSKQGHRSHSQTVTLSAKQNLKLDIPVLSPIYGGLDISSTPGNAQITIDGVKRGLTPDCYTDILEGPHKVSVSKSGYVTQSRNVIVTEGKIEELQFSLIKGASPSYETFESTKPKTNESAKIAQFYIGGGYSLGAISSAVLNLGVNIGKLNLEADYNYALSKSQTIYWYGAGSYEASYSPSLILSGKIGWVIPCGEKFSLTPQAGARFVKTKETTNRETSFVNGANCLSATLGLRAEYSLSKHFGICLTPEYSLPIKKSPGYEIITDAQNAISNFNTPYSITAGAVVKF